MGKWYMKCFCTDKVIPWIASSKSSDQKSISKWAFCWSHNSPKASTILYTHTIMQWVKSDSRVAFSRDFLWNIHSLIRAYVWNLKRADITKCPHLQIQTTVRCTHSNTSLMKINYRIVKNASQSRFEAHVGLFRLLMEGIFDVLCFLGKKLIF